MRIDAPAVLEGAHHMGVHPLGFNLAQHVHHCWILSHVPELVLHETVTTTIVHTAPCNDRAIF